MSEFPRSDYGPLADIYDKVQAGERLSFEDGVRLYRTNDLPLLGSLAHKMRTRMNANRVFYSVNLHMNHTNVCTLRCLFCAFARRPGEEGGYTYSVQEIIDKVRQAAEKWSINEVHIVGGHNPDLGMDYYLDLFRSIRREAPTLYIKALTAPEIDDLAIHRIAHRLGLKTNATMLYGHIESDEDRVDHVLRLRELQDETRGFYSFIPLAYNAENTPMGKIGEAGGFLDLKVYAVSRLLCDNIPHLKAHWITTGLKLGQVALSFGIDDLGGTNLNEKIVHDAGSETPVDLSREELERLIRNAGYEPCLVDSSYQFVEAPKSLSS